MRWKKSNTAKRHQHEDLGLSSQLDLDQEFDSDLDYFPLETEGKANTVFTSIKEIKHLIHVYFHLYNHLFCVGSC